MASIRLLLPGFALVAPTALAQSGVISARVIDLHDTSGIGEAEVSVIGTPVRARSDSTGHVRLADVRPGSYEIDARRLGYKPVRSRVMVLQGDTAEVLLAMQQTSALLAGMKVTETAAQLHLREFEARLRNHTGGYFITDSVIRIHDPEGIQALLHARVPGIRVEVPYQGKIVAYSTRGQTSLKDTGKCIVGVFVDGIRMGDGDAGVVPLFDLAGIEYYPPSLAPVQYRIPPPVAGAGGRRAELLRAACFSSGLVLSARLERRHVGARRMPLIRL